MALMDAFTSDDTVTMKHTEYYQLMREAAKAELITNAVVADVPNCYTKAMITGEKPKIEEMETIVNKIMDIVDQYRQKT